MPQTEPAGSHCMMHCNRGDSPGGAEAGSGAYNACNDGPGLRMTTLTIRNIPPELKERLRVRAAVHGRSMEAELRQILRDALTGEKRRREPNLAEAIRRRFLPLGGADEIEPHPPAAVGEPPTRTRAAARASSGSASPTSNRATSS
jgi:plasmid stability protein